VHEFGHSFVGLLDEYTNNPGTPPPDLKAPNVSLTPDPDKVPWAHFLKKHVPGVTVKEGGATYIKGAWRPSLDCAMNSAGHMNYCPVCREAAVLRIYAYVNPIDAFSPSDTRELEVAANSDQVLAVTPMRPRSHSLDCDWYVEAIGSDVPMPEPVERSTGGGTRADRIREALFGPTGGTRANETGRDTLMSQPPAGKKDALGTTRKTKDGSIEQVFPVGRLKPGRYRVTAEVSDGTPWVLLDAKHLLQERKTWFVKVTAPSAAAK
jgi:hypothetical protein